MYELVHDMNTMRFHTAPRGRTLERQSHDHAKATRVSKHDIGTFTCSSLFPGLFNGPGQPQGWMDPQEATYMVITCPLE